MLNLKYYYKSYNLFTVKAGSRHAIDQPVVLRAYYEALLPVV